MDQTVDVKLDEITQVNNLSQVEPMSDDVSDDPSSPESTTFDDSDLLSGSCVPDDVTSHLAAAGPIGVAAAAAIVTGKKRKRPHSFETNPSIRKRQATRLLRKLKQVIDEFTTRVGQQACVVVCCPGKVHSSFKVFGAAPLENVIRNCKQLIMQDLENALQQQAPQPQQDSSGLHELPPLVVDGIPTPVDKMTQAQLRAFIPVMLKYSTGRGKPGWGKDSTRPPWWPEDVPWANVRSDARTEEEKASVSWTNALRKIVRNCYKYHGRHDLLIEFRENDQGQTPEQTQQQQQQAHFAPVQYPHMVHTINNADGTVSIIQVDATGSVTTLSEAGSHSEATQAVATLAEVASASQGEVMLNATHGAGVDGGSLQNSEAAQAAVNTLAEATLQDGGHFILSDAASAAAAALVGVQETPGVGGVVSIPVQAAAAMMQIQGGNIIPISTAAALQLISTNSIQHIAVAQANDISAAPSSIATSIASTTAEEDMSQVHIVTGSEQNTETVPTASHAVEVVTLADAAADPQ